MKGWNDGSEARGWVSGKCAGASGTEQWVKETYCHTEKPAGEVQGTGTTITTPGESYIDPAVRGGQKVSDGQRFMTVSSGFGSLLEKARFRALR